VRIALRSVLFAALAFVTVGVPTYLLLWNRAGLNAVTPDDGPGVVLGTFWCMAWTVVNGSFAAICTFAITLVIGLRRRIQELPMPE
jgi:hypothetical protein